MDDAARALEHAKVNAAAEVHGKAEEREANFLHEHLAIVREQEHALSQTVQRAEAAERSRDDWLETASKRESAIQHLEESCTTLKLQLDAAFESEHGESLVVRQVLEKAEQDACTLECEFNERRLEILREERQITEEANARAELAEQQR